MYIAAYLEDQISGLGLWQSFTTEHKRLYGKYLPFYAVSSDYIADEINEEDIRFIIWNTWQKVSSLHEHAYINPNNPSIKSRRKSFMPYWKKPMKKLLKTKLCRNTLAIRGVRWKQTAN